MMAVKAACNFTMISMVRSAAWSGIWCGSLRQDCCRSQTDRRHAISQLQAINAATLMQINAVGCSVGQCNRNITLGFLACKALRHQIHRERPFRISTPVKAIVS